MTPLFILLILFLAAVETLASYISRVYSEFGKILTREIEENLDAWEELVEPQLGLTRGHAAICAAVLQQLTLGIIALEFGALLFDRAPYLARPTPGEIAQAVLAMVLVVVFCNQLLPTLLFNRTQGRWARRLVWPIRLLLWLMTPITVFVRFFYSVASLAEEPVTAEEESEADVEALLEAGEEEGILEESDRELVRSAVEFGDKLVREVMTPRPEVFAVPATLTLEAFLEELREHNFSRVPVYSGSIDNITGIAFAHDLLQIARRSSSLKPSASTSCCARCSARSSTCASSSTSTAASVDWSPLRICSKRSSAKSATSTRKTRPSKSRSASPAASGWSTAAFPSTSCRTSSASRPA
jgi:CBS domain containing-hemolysin-like protein